MAKKARVKTPTGRSIFATDVYSKDVRFYCDTEGCNAEMVIVSMGEATAHFRSKHISDHIALDCIRNDIEFDSDKYDKSLFSLDSFKSKILSSYESVNIHAGHGGGGMVGTGSKIAPNTLKSIYAAYLDSKDSGIDTIGDCKFSDFIRCRENHMDFVANPNGFYVLETSIFRRVEGETSFILNVPPLEAGKHIKPYHVKAIFTNEKDFETVKKHIEKLKHHYFYPMLFATEWKAVFNNPNYIAEGVISKRTQHTYLALEKPK